MNILKTILSFSKSRKMGNIKAKAILIKKLRENYGLSYPEIARLFGNNHTTIMHLYKKFRKGYFNKCGRPKKGK